MRWHRKLKRLSPLRPIEKRNRPKQRVLLHLEELETRALLSANSAAPEQPATTPTNNETVHPLLTVTHPSVSPQSSPGISGYTPQQIQQAYGVDKLLNNGTNGKGETIAIVDAYSDPSIVSDANTFNAQFNLPIFNSAGGPTLTVVAAGGGSASNLSQDSTGGWPLETSLDVEWAHAIAPQANILLVESADATDPVMFSAVQWAASETTSQQYANGTVAAVSMSWGDYETNISDEHGTYDPYFEPYSSTNPNGFTNPGVTFVAASGDSGAGTIYPAASPYVLAVGGTTLSTTTNASGGTVYGSEAGWSGSGGGPAQFEGYPSYQYNQPWIASTYGYPDNVQVYNYATGTYSYYSSRMNPDVAYNADPNSGFAVYDSIPSADYGTVAGWNEVGGTSAGSPQWAAIVALADQQRNLTIAGDAGRLDTNQVLNTLYNTLGSSPTNPTYTSIFHDITTGSNGYSAGVGYDLVTGLGSPIANTLVPLLANTSITQGGVPTITGSGYGATGTGGFGGTSGFGTTGFGSTTFFSFTSLGTFFARSGADRPGGGLYTGSGSLSIQPGPVGINSPNGQMGGAPISSTTPLAGAPVMPSAASLTFSISTVDAEITISATGENDLIGQVSALVPGTPFAGAGITPSVASANALALQSNNVFGASGWNGPPALLKPSSLALPTSQPGQLADDPSESLQYVEDQSAEDASGMEAFVLGEGVAVLDSTSPTSHDDGDAGGGDAGDGGDG
jgi:hypothetical protein